MPTQSPSLFVYLIAVPIFILTIAIEWWLSVKRREPELYDLADTVSNLQLGSGQLLVGLISILILGVNINLTGTMGIVLICLGLFMI